MKKIESVGYSTIHAELTAAAAPVRTIQKSEKAKLIHEHYLVPSSRKELNQFATYCITCGDCQTCGKLIGPVE